MRLSCAGVALGRPAEGLAGVAVVTEVLAVGVLGAFFAFGSGRPSIGASSIWNEATLEIE